MKRIIFTFLITILTCNLFAQIKTSIDSTQIIYAQSLNEDAEVTVINGQQDIYSYIISVE